MGWQHQRYQRPSSAGDLNAFVDFGGFWTSLLDHVFVERQWRGEGGMVGNLRLQYSNYRLATDSAFINRFTNFRPGYEYAESQRWRLESQWQWQLAAHRLIVGGHAADIHAIPKAPDMSRPYDPDRGSTAQGLFYAGTNNTLPLRIFEVDKREAGLYVQDTLALRPNLDVTAGLHYGHNSEYTSLVTPHANLNWRFADGWRTGVLYGEAFLAPSSQFAYEHFGSFTSQQDAQGRYISGFMFLPNPALEPEELQTWELSLGHFTAQYEWQLAAYRNHLDGLILSQVTTPPESNFVPGGFIQSTRKNDNVGELTATGVDVYGRWLASPQADLWLAYGYVDGTLNRLGVKSGLPYTAHHNLRLGLSWQLTPALMLSPAVEATGRSYPLPHTRTDGVTHAPGYALVHLLTRYRLGSALDLELRATNLMDKRWYNVGNSSSNTFNASPQDTRLVAIGVVWRL